MEAETKKNTLVECWMFRDMKDDGCVFLVSVSLVGPYLQRR